jgi:uncharacterized protein
MWRGQLFLFDRPQPAAHTPQQGYKLLAIFISLELIVRPFTRHEAQALGIAQRNWWSLLQLSFLLALACWLTARFAGVRLSQVGLYPWRQWSKIERIYFPQILGLSITIFGFAQAAELKALWGRPDLWRTALVILVEQMIWGFYQELMYRGVLQTELVRRCGAPLGVLLSNLIFTFGPLHFYHFAQSRQHPEHLWIFAAIFAIGLYFAMLMLRSCNLWMVASLHGLGDWFIDGLVQISRMVR